MRRLFQSTRKGTSRPVEMWQRTSRDVWHEDRKEISVAPVHQMRSWGGDDYNVLDSVVSLNDPVIGISSNSNFPVRIRRKLTGSLKRKCPTAKGNWMGTLGRTTVAVSSPVLSSVVENSQILHFGLDSKTGFSQGPPPRGTLKLTVHFSEQSSKMEWWCTSRTIEIIMLMWGKCKEAFHFICEHVSR